MSDQFLLETCKRICHIHTESAQRVSITRRPLQFFPGPARVEAYDGENDEVDELAA